MRIDPTLAAAIPEMTALEFRGLKESIATHGYFPAHEVVITADDEVLLDGLWRWRACEELGKVAPIARVNVPPEDRWNYRVVSNLRRRHLTIDQRRELLREYLKRNPQMSNRAAAAATGVDDHTIATARRSMGESSPFPALGGVPAQGAEFPRPPSESRGDVLDDAADHRNQVWFETTFGYPCESEQPRTRGQLEYKLASERLLWISGRQYLVTPAATTDGEFRQVLQEHANRLARLVVERPWKTMHRALSV